MCVVSCVRVAHSLTHKLWSMCLPHGMSPCDWAAVQPPEDVRCRLWAETGIELSLSIPLAFLSCERLEFNDDSCALSFLITTCVNTPACYNTIVLTIVLIHCCLLRRQQYVKYHTPAALMGYCSHQQYCMYSVRAEIGESILPAERLR